MPVKISATTSDWRQLSGVVAAPGSHIAHSTAASWAEDQPSSEYKTAVGDLVDWEYLGVKSKHVAETAMRTMLTMITSR